MKFDRLFVVVLGPGLDMIESAAKHMPYLADATHIGFMERRFQAYTLQFKMLTDGVFGGYDMTIRDKIMIFAHGDASNVMGNEAYSAKRMAEKFKEWGIKKAGLVTFKCCNVGSGNYLEDFKSNFAENGLSIGWLKGYKGFAVTSTKEKSSGKIGPTEKIYSKEGQAPDDLITGDSRYKLIEGNAAYTIEGSRFAVGRTA